MVGTRFRFRFRWKGSANRMGEQKSMKMSWFPLSMGLLAIQGAGASDFHLLEHGACEWSLEETLRIGSMDGEDALTEVLALDLGPDGHVYVAQQFATSVAVFTSTGRLQRSVGRAGEGPGEFRTSLLDLGWRGDTLWVTDVTSVQYLTAAGTPERGAMFSVFLPQESARFTPAVPLADGTYLGWPSVAGNIRRFFKGGTREHPSVHGDGGYGRRPRRDIARAGGTGRGGIRHASSRCGTPATVRGCP